MTPRSSTAAPILALLAIVLVTLGAYVGGYFWLGQCEIFSDEVRVFRIFANGTLKTGYTPVAFVESKCKGVDVFVMSQEEWESFLGMLITSAPVVDPEA